MASTQLDQPPKPEIIHSSDSVLTQFVDTERRKELSARFPRSTATNESGGKNESGDKNEYGDKPAKKDLTDIEFQQLLDDARDPLSKHIREGDQSMKKFIENTDSWKLVEAVRRNEPSQLTKIFDQMSEENLVKLHDRIANHRFPGEQAFKSEFDALGDAQERVHQ